MRLSRTERPILALPALQEYDRFCHMPNMSKRNMQKCILCCFSRSQLQPVSTTTYRSKLTWIQYLISHHRRQRGRAVGEQLSKMPHDISTNNKCKPRAYKITVICNWITRWCAVPITRINHTTLKIATDWMNDERRRTLNSTSPAQSAQHTWAMW